MSLDGNRPHRSLGKRVRNFYRTLRRSALRVLLCSMNKHRPHRGRAKYTNGKWHSRCRNCGIAMHRIRQGQWVLLESDR